MEQLFFRKTIILSQGKVEGRKIIVSPKVTGLKVERIGSLTNLIR